MSPPSGFPSASLDALRELMNIGMGRAARAIAELSGREVTLRVLEVEMLDLDDPHQLADLRGQINLRVSQSFTGGLRGHAMLALHRAGAVRLAQLLLGKSADDEAFDELEQGALLELGNIVIGAAVGLLASELDAPVRYDLPQLQLRGVAVVADLLADLADPTRSRIFVMRASLVLREDSVSGYLILLFPEQSMATLNGCLARLTTR